MLSLTDSLPLTIDPVTADFMRGIYEIKGLLRFEGHRAIVEYRASSVGFGMNTVQVFSFDLAQVRSVEWRKNMFGGRIIFKANSLTTFEQMVGVDGDTLTLKIGRKARKRAADVIASVQLALSEIKLDRLSG